MIQLLYKSFVTTFIKSQLEKAKKNCTILYYFLFYDYIFQKLFQRKNHFQLKIKLLPMKMVVDDFMERSLVVFQLVSSTLLDHLKDGHHPNSKVLVLKRQVRDYRNLKTLWMQKTVVLLV